jgi:hypothetical protein
MSTGRVNGGEASRPLPSSNRGRVFEKTVSHYFACWLAQDLFSYRGFGASSLRSSQKLASPGTNRYFVERAQSTRSNLNEQWPDRKKEFCARKRRLKVIPPTRIVQLHK